MFRRHSDASPLRADNEEVSKEKVKKVRYIQREGRKTERQNEKEDFLFGQAKY